MALFYDCGKGLVETRQARADCGADVYLVCPGPSMARTLALADPRGPGAITVGVNTAYPAFRPDWWVGMDRPACYDAALPTEPFPKVFRKGFAGEMVGGRKLSGFPQTYFAGVDDKVSPAQMFARRAHGDPFCWGGDTFTVAMHLAVWMGAKRIHLVGCDFGGERDYHDDRVLSDPNRERNRQLYRKLVAWLPILRWEAEARGVELISCTPGSPANNHVPYLPITEAVGATRASAAVPAAPVLHCKDAELCRWGSRRPRDGIVTGADGSQEWLLPWWHDRVREIHPYYPLAFANFGGMSDQMVKWCKARGEYLDLSEPAGIPAWHKKPLAILRAGYVNTLWMDADCEVRRDLSGWIKDPGRKHGVAVTRDPFHVGAEYGTDYATGVVCATHGDPLIEAWAKSLLADPKAYRGDQEAFNAVCGDYPLDILPPQYQRVRLEGEQPDAIVYHWTGPQGKKHIRDSMGVAAAV